VTAKELVLLKAGFRDSCLGL